MSHWAVPSCDIFQSHFNIALTTVHHLYDDDDEDDEDEKAAVTG